MKTYMANNQTVKPVWYVVDAEGQTLGHLATQVASLLLGKDKPIFTPNCNCGDYVIVVNADKVKLTGKKWSDKKYYYHSAYNGGLKCYTASELMAKFPTRMVEQAVSGMIPHTKLGNTQRKRLFVYAGPNHEHQAQQPVEYKLK